MMAHSISYKHNVCNKPSLNVLPETLVPLVATHIKEPAFSGATGYTFKHFYYRVFTYEVNKSPPCETWPVV